MVINDQFARTIKGRNRGSMRPLERRLCLTRPPGVGSASPDPKSAGSASSDSTRGYPNSPDPEDAR
jgi:hypothetical protein